MSDRGDSNSGKPGGGDQTNHRARPYRVSSVSAAPYEATRRRRAPDDAAPAEAALPSEAVGVTDTGATAGPLPGPRLGPGPGNGSTLGSAAADGAGAAASRSTDAAADTAADGGSQGVSPTARLDAASGAMPPDPAAAPATSADPGSRDGDGSGAPGPGAGSDAVAGSGASTGGDASGADRSDRPAAGAPSTLPVRQTAPVPLPAAPRPAAAAVTAPPSLRGSAAPPIPGPRSWSARWSVVTGFAALLIIFGGFGAWAIGARIAGAVVAHGQVEVERNRQVVQHPDGGVVDEIFVRDGQRVEAGQPLIRLDGALLKTELAIVTGQYFESLSRRGRLEAERSDETAITFPDELVAAARTDTAAKDLMAGQTSLFDARRATLDQSLQQLDKQTEQLRAQIAGIDFQSTAFGKQRELIGEELTDAETLLAKGLAQAPRVLALQREAAGLDGQIGELTSTRAQAESKVIEVGVERLRLNAERRETAETELRDLGYRELELAERRRSLTSQVSRLEITAPVSGIVLQMQVTTPRSVVRAAEPVLYIIPQDRPLVIAAQIAPINVDEIHPGQQVVLRFSAFSSRTTPEIDGVLDRVSADAVVDEATRTSYYRAEVTIPPEQMAKLGNLEVKPGMPVEVYVQTGERSPMAYLMKPLTDYFVRAFRET